MCSIQEIVANYCHSPSNVERGPPIPSRCLMLILNLQDVSSFRDGIPPTLMLIPSQDVVEIRPRAVPLVWFWFGRFICVPFL